MALVPRYCDCNSAPSVSVLEFLSTALYSAVQNSVVSLVSEVSTRTDRIGVLFYFIQGGKSFIILHLLAPSFVMGEKSWII